MHFGPSQYQASFKKHGSGEKRRVNELPPAAFPAQRQCIIVEDFPNRMTGSSSQKDDFRDMTQTIRQANVRAIGNETKVLAF